MSGGVGGGQPLEAQSQAVTHQPTRFTHTHARTHAHKPPNRRLISQVAKVIYNVEGGKVTPVQGSIEGYKAQLQKKLALAEEKFEKERRARASTKSGGGSL